MNDNYIDYMANEVKRDFDQRPKRKVDLSQFELNWRDFFFFIVMYIGLQYGLMLVIPVFSLIFDLSVGTNTYAHIFDIQYITLIDSLAFIIALSRFRSVKEFLQGRFNRQALYKRRTILYIILAFATNYFIQYMMTDAFMFEQSGSQVDLFGIDHIDLNIMNTLFLVLAFVVITPIVEETLFRGLIFGFLDKKLGFKPALYISSISFGLLHPGHRISTTLMGMVFVYLYKKTDSLWALILLHAVWNAYATYTLISFM